jgi:hypothetical protein
LAEPPSDNIWGYRNDKKDEEENNGNVVIKYISTDQLEKKMVF